MVHCLRCNPPPFFTYQISSTRFYDDTLRNTRRILHSGDKCVLLTVTDVVLALVPDAASLAISLEEATPVSPNNCTYLSFYSSNVYNSARLNKNGETTCVDFCCHTLLRTNRSTSIFVMTTRAANNTLVYIVSHTWS